MVTTTKTTKSGANAKNRTTANMGSSGSKNKPVKAPIKKTTAKRAK